MKRVMDNAYPVGSKRFDFGPQGGDQRKPDVSFFADALTIRRKLTIRTLIRTVHFFVSFI